MKRQRQMDGYYTTNEASEKLGVSRPYMWGLTKKGFLPEPLKEKGCAYYPIAEIERLIEERKQKLQDELNALNSAQ